MERKIYRIVDEKWIGRNVYFNFEAEEKKGDYLRVPYDPVCGDSKDDRGVNLRLSDLENIWWANYNVEKGYHYVVDAMQEDVMRFKDSMINALTSAGWKSVLINNSEPEKEK